MGYLKTYKTHSNEAIIKLKYAGIDVTCHFVNGNIRMGKWATLTTANEIVQRAIEDSWMFGRSILPEGEPIPLEDKKDADPADITNISQLREYLVNKHNCNRQKISSPNALKGKVKELGLELPNMVW